MIRRRLRRWVDRRAATRLIWRLHESLDGPKDIPDLIVEAWLWEVIGQHGLAEVLMATAAELADTPPPCRPDLIDGPTVTPIEHGAELHWACCGRRSTVAAAQPFRLYPELIRAAHQGAIDYEALQEEHHAP